MTRTSVKPTGFSLTSPVPQAIDLLTASGIAVPAAVQAVRYDPCLCLLLDFPEAASALLEAPGGFKITDDPAITWIASQRAKGVRLALNDGRGDGLVIHTSGAWSSVRYALTETQILDQLMPAALAILNRCGITHIPARAELKKWKYSLPTITVPESCVVLDTRLPLILAGDAFGNRPRVEGAWCSGIAAALTLDRMPLQHGGHNRNS